MTDHDKPARPARGRRIAALVAAGVLLPLPALAGCGDDGGREASVTEFQDIAPAPRGDLRDGGTLRWAIDAMPGTFNAFQADADAATTRIAGAVLPSMFTLDAHGTPQRNADYLDAADVSARDPKQVVTYTINSKARWSDGTPITAADFIAQWTALRGKDSAYWTARNAGYDRIGKVEQGAGPREVKVTFARPYADWRSLFTPLYPKSVMGDANAFNDRARERLTVGAGPFLVQQRDAKRGRVVLARNPKWWGAPAKLRTIVLEAVPGDKRAAALAAGTVDVAAVDPGVAQRVGSAAGAGTSRKAGAGDRADGRTGARAAKDDAAKKDTAKDDAAKGNTAKEAAALRGYTLHKALEPAYTQLALNGSSGPLADDRVRRAVARAIDRQALADTVLKPLDLPSRAVGSHLLLAGQPGYADHSDALGDQDAGSAKALLADAGWKADDGDGQQAEQKSEEKAGGRGGETAAEEKAGAPAPGVWRGVDDFGASGPPGGTGFSGHSGHSGHSGQSRHATNPRDEDGEGSSRNRSGGAAHGERYGDGSFGERADSGHARHAGHAGAPARDGRYDGMRPAAAEAPLSFTGAVGSEVQQAALLRQSAGFYKDAAARAKQKADGDKKSAAYAKYKRYRKRAARALRAAERIETGQAADLPGAGGHPGARHAAAERALGAAAHAARRPADDTVVRAGTVKKDGKPLTLRFVLPDGAGSQQLRTVGRRIATMLAKIGVQTSVQRVSDASYFQDHIASGDFDLALYSWPGSAYPATDARPIYAKPQPAPDGSLTVEQNYSRVGTDHIDQLFDQAAGELDESSARTLMDQADARIWAAAGSVPLYQRPELVATRKSLANVGAFGFTTPRFQDIGYKK
ncbi:ABC transporter substrate-binding protein [Streptomyces sp. NBRC 110611]|uniref:ABC transporter substrate-binding protein n=1 Tax=Streptomyces sp. NBRC 110611 TaxID=1621259 RepID=UPI0008365BC5|nr:ABC transporter substrate-binding protein [Streptomyces sp. NBRC 110611]GAU65256.1 ABC transporter substrate-binding protein [Streptomyces sp. NBRC 110611]